MTAPIVLVIMDGWGIAPKGPSNAIGLAKTPHLDRLFSTFPNTQLEAAGEAVGLPKGEDGNTETGHLNIGAGRIVYQDLPRINQSIADGSFFQNQAFLQAVNHTKQYRSNLHLMGLIGTGGVHSSNEHLLALVRLCKNNQVKQLYLHLFTDGRDSPPTSALNFIDQITQELKQQNLGSIATIMGRYYGMDRDLRWDRTQVAYLALTEARGEKATSPRQAINQAYQQKLTDEFIKPTIILDGQNQPLPRIKDNDAVIFYNFRIDRPRQLTKAFVLPNFESLPTETSFDPYAIKYYKTHTPPATPHQKPFVRTTKLENLFFVTMTEYERGLPTTSAFPPQIIKNPLAQVLSNNNKKQLHIAETEKERFVTYYFNGFREDPFPGEDRVIIPSAKVATYDLKPEMSAFQTTETLLERSASSNYDFIVINIANPDMVGHTGNIEATIKACEITDQCIGKISLNILGQNGTVLITADHGNAEELINHHTGETDTEHSLNPVPFIIAQNQLSNQKLTLQKGILADIAPTILKLLNIPKPEEMTGKELI